MVRLWSGKIAARLNNIPIFGIQVSVHVPSTVTQLTLFLD